MTSLARAAGIVAMLAALSAWGVEHFQGLTAGLELPLGEAGEAASQLSTRTREYYAGLNDAGLSLFRKFFRVAAVVSLVAILPALAMGPDRSEAVGIDTAGSSYHR